MVVVEEQAQDGPLADVLARRPGAPDGVALDWLGQAGFALRCNSKLFIIDPYLSDFLAEKYRGKELPHARMMPSPVAPADVRGVGVVLCTHRHTDHMDPGTLPSIAASNPRCLFVVPRSEAAHAIEIGIPEVRLRSMDAGETLRPEDGLTVEAVASAHTELSRNERGEFHHLGYIMTVCGLRIYHSGDCVPYEGLEETLRASAIDAALLPVNGRSERLTSRGIIGNFFLEEAVALCKSAGIRLLFCHHWGMFDFNTIDPRAAKEKIARLGDFVKCILPRVGVSYLVRKT